MVVSDDSDSDIGILEFAEEMTKRMLSTKDRDSTGIGGDLYDGFLKDSAQPGPKEASGENLALPLHNYTLIAGPTARPNRRCALAGCNCLCSCGCSCDAETDETEERQPEPVAPFRLKPPSSSTNTASAKQDVKPNVSDATENDEIDYAMLLSLPDYNFEASSLPCSRHWDGAQMAFANVANRWLTINPDY